ncbi:MAG: hypothetical protein M1833_002936 [Piccolia ochrophora]|nr:MAG: hypothetical protein M1833_002936 [Piccolia ochrophora]
MSSQPPNRSFPFQHYDDERVQSQRSGEHFDQRQYARPYRDSNSPSRGDHPSPSYGHVDAPSRDVDVSPPSPPQHRSHPAAHPSSSFARLQAKRNSGVQSNPGHSPPESSQPTATYDSAPKPPPHVPHSAAPKNYVVDARRSWGQGVGHSTSQRSAATATPGADNLGDRAAGGGIAGIALGVAANNERQSGVQALREIDNAGHPGPPDQSNTATMNGLAPEAATYELDAADPYATPRPSPARGLHPASSYSSTIPLGNAAIAPGQSTPGARSDMSQGSYPSQDRLVADSGGHYMDNPYKRYSTTWDPRVSQTGLGNIDPNEIEDDGDDGFAPRDGNRRSVLSMGKGSSHGILPAAAGGAAGGAAAGGVMGSVGGFFKRSASNGNAAHSTSGDYGPVPVNGALPTGYNGYDGNDPNGEKSEWMRGQESGKKKLKWAVGILVVLLVIGAIVGGTVGGILASRNKGGGSRGGKGSADGKDLNSESSEIQDLTENSELHKVFSGIAYTPLNAQYPECLSYPLIQSNITQDMAVLGQLTNKIRLYGTDCGQTELVVEAIKALELDDMKVWLGVHQDANKTTNKRQLEDMYKILDEYGADPFEGVVIGNELLFRKEMTVTELGNLLTDVRSNLKKKDIDLPIATSDLGDNWDVTLAAKVDVIMANIHPFFAGGTVKEAAGWTWDFWHQHTDVLTDQVPNKPRTIISEVGWPSGGGNVCGQEGVKCKDKTSGSVAGVKEMNTFMETYVCQAFANQTEYFWFTAFDEPWKKKYNTADRALEDKWGLMDADRNLKPGLKIPDCGGKEVS